MTGYLVEEVLNPQPPAVRDVLLSTSILERVSAHPFLHREAQPGGALTVSIGIAAPDSELPEADRLLLAADRALYQAKGAGRNRVVAV